MIQWPFKLKCCDYKLNSLVIQFGRCCNSWLVVTILNAHPVHILHTSFDYFSVLRKSHACTNNSVHTVALTNSLVGTHVGIFMVFGNITDSTTRFRTVSSLSRLSDCHKLSSKGCALWFCKYGYHCLKSTHLTCICETCIHQHSIILYHQ